MRGIPPLHHLPLLNLVTSLLLGLASLLVCQAAEKPAPATPPPTAKKRAGGGPENPELKFKLPPPSVLTPQEALKTFKLPPGFRIEVVAAEPLIESPIAISFDDQGRIYVVEMRGYMHDVDGKGEDQRIGRVSRLEDTDGDGVMDKSTVFVDKLLMPRAVMAMGDGALIAEPPNLTYYRDTDGDGVADAQIVVSTSFGAKGGQPEHMANTPMWALDNWIWCANHALRYRWQRGQFIADNTGGNRGQWGLTQDDWGRLYFNYNSDLLRCDLIAPAFYARNPNLPSRTALNHRVMTDQTTWPAHPTPGVNRGYGGNLRNDGSLKSVTAVCGAGIYRGDLFAKEFLGNAFVPEPSGNLVKRLVLSESGGVVTAKNAYDGREFLTSTDERFRPVNALTGPDGALYIVDMARGILQHKGFLTYYLVANIHARKLETPVNLGRIYRIVPTDAKPKSVKLPREAAAIVPLLGHSNGWVRDTAQRVLVERGGASIVPALKELAAKGATPQARVHALWTLEGIGPLDPEFIATRLQDSDAKVRLTAIRLADRTVLPELLPLAKDANADVRLQLALRISPETGNEVDAALLTLLKLGGSPLLAEAVASGLRGRELDFLETLLREVAVKNDSIDKSGLLPLLAGCVMNERRPGRVARLIELIAAQTAGSPRQLALLDATVGKPPAKGSPAPKLVYLEKEPTTFLALKAKASGKVKTALATLDNRLAWPGKLGVPPPPIIVPLTEPQQALFERGKTVYGAICAACHQPSGAGLDGLAPPLLDSEWVLGAADLSIRIVLHGVTGPLLVGNTTWRLDMPPVLGMSDEDIAGVLTYTRREWEHTASPVSPAEVAKIRAATNGRAQAWTVEELRKPIPTKGK